MKAILYDGQLCLEVLKLDGIAQSFPSHFHTYYVIGYMERGERNLLCMNKEYTVSKGDILLFNPEDSHSCFQHGKEAMTYYGMNIEKDVMRNLIMAVMGKDILPYFRRTVIKDDEASSCIKTFIHSSDSMEREENLSLLISILVMRYALEEREDVICDKKEEIEKACKFIRTHYNEHISLSDISRCCGLKCSTLIRAFTKAKGMTPYTYLESIRIETARKLLSEGMSLGKAALESGFSDQSHLTNYFVKLTGITPGMYKDIFNKGERGNGK